MTNRLYVGNLPFHATEDLIQQHFAPCGEVLSVNLMLDRATGQSRGFAFVEMKDPDGAKNALEMNGKELSGRALRIDVAEDRRSGGGSRGGGGGGYRGGGGGGRGGGYRG